MAASLVLSPAELAYLHASLSLTPPIRPDGRSATQFRPLTAETGFLPGTNGSARVCFADGTEAIVGVKAEIERTPRGLGADESDEGEGDESALKEGEVPENDSRARPGMTGCGDWLELAVEIPGLRDDEASTVFLASVLREGLLADGTLVEKLRINRRFHWKMYLDILLISPPLAYPLPLLSLTTHLALLAARLPRLKSEGDEDPMFDDDWEAAPYLYPRASTAASPRPPITLLVVTVGKNIIFDPSKEELAVADVALAVSVAEARRRDPAKGKGKAVAGPEGAETTPRRDLTLLSIRTIDPPARSTPPGVPNALNPANSGAVGGAPPNTPLARQVAAKVAAGESVEGVWKAPLGGAKFAVLSAMIEKVLEPGGVAEEVLDGLEGVELT